MVVQDQPQNLGSIKYDAETHVAMRSSGCGRASPYKAGKTTVSTGRYAGVTWTYRVYVPYSYDPSEPMPLIIQHPGWGMSAASEETGCGISSYADSLGFISVTAQGMNDNPNFGGPWYSWNAVGTTQSPGPAGPTCTSAANHPNYCYSSCGYCSDSPQCDWTTCDETVTPTGTGRSEVGGFIPGLYDTLESQLCIDTTREYAAGESNGGMQTYQLGVDLASRLAAIVPQFGSFHRGFAMAPAVPVPVLDLHGSKDTTVPANVSLSADGYYYTTTAEIFGGSPYSDGWKSANGCYPSPSQYVTKLDGQQGLYCQSECADGTVVRCMWNGGHNWLFNSASANGYLVTLFALAWAKPAHLGAGSTRGHPPISPKPLQNVTILYDEPLPPLLEPLVGAAPSLSHLVPDDTAADADSSALGGSSDVSRQFAMLPTSLAPSGAGAGHYGDPDAGCRPDEEPVAVGTGRICAPKVQSRASMQQNGYT